MSGQIVPATFDYQKAVRYMTARRGGRAMLARRMNREHTTIRAWEEGGNPTGDSVLELINEAYRRLTDEQFRECAGW